MESQKIGACGLPTGRVLDVGYGQGLVAREMVEAEGVTHVVSLDWKPLTADLHSDRHSLVWVDAREYDTRERYDFMYFDTIETMESYDITHQAIANCTRFLKPGGRFVVNFMADHPMERSLRAWLAENFDGPATLEVQGLMRGNNTVVYYTKRSK